jgi:hypothetical protein
MKRAALITPLFSVLFRLEAFFPLFSTLELDESAVQVPVEFTPKASPVFAAGCAAGASSPPPVRPEMMDVPLF